MLLLKTPLRSVISSVTCFLFLFYSCSKEDISNKVELIDPSLKEIVINTGFTDNIITVKSNDWRISYIKDGLTKERLKDANGLPLQLETNGEILLKEGWLQLTKTADNTLSISLKENFTDNPRNFIIGIESGNRIEEMHFVQNRGERYELVKKEIQEIEGSRQIYRSSEGCKLISLSNGSNESINMETTSIYDDVKYRSTFSSTDIDAFNWIDTENSLLFMNEVLLDGSVVWEQQVAYKKGDTFTNYINNNTKQFLLVRPYTNISLRGEIDYLERASNYTFTIKNKDSGHQFQIKGVWSQKIPVASHTIIL